MNLFRDIDLTSGNIIPMRGNLPLLDKAPLKKYNSVLEEKIKSLIQDVENSVKFYKGYNELKDLSLKNRERLVLFYERQFRNTFVPQDININNDLPLRQKISFAIKEESSVIAKANTIMEDLRLDDKEILNSFIYDQIVKIGLLTSIFLDIR